MDGSNEMTLFVYGSLFVCKYVTMEIILVISTENYKEEIKV